MSRFSISLDPRAKLTPEQIERVHDIIRQCRTEEDIRWANEEAQRDQDRERDNGWDWMRR